VDSDKGGAAVAGAGTGVALVGSGTGSCSCSGSDVRVAEAEAECFFCAWTSAVVAGVSLVAALIDAEGGGTNADAFEGSFAVDDELADLMLLLLLLLGDGDEAAIAA